MSQRRRAAATGKPGPRRAYPGQRARPCSLHSVDTLPSSAVPRRLDLGPSPGAAAELHLRAA